jgi:hypothetical protein
MPEKRFNAETGGGLKTRLLALCVFVSLVLAHGFTHAARSFSYAQSPAAAAAVFDMGSTQSLTYLITNTNTPTNTGERIHQVRFRLSGTGTVFSSTTAAPPGWTRSAFSTTSVTFLASSWSNAIAAGGSASFTPVLVMRSATADVTETLQYVRAYYTTTATGPPFTSLTSITTNNAGSWTLKCLAITSFQITDTSGIPISTLVAGGSFRLVMTVRNNSASTQIGITANPSPPNAFTTGTVTQSLTGTVGSPLTLIVLASGTITFTFSTSASDSGTIYFRALAQRIASVTSSSATSPTLTLTPVASCSFSASFTAPASSVCQYPGSIALTMTILTSATCPALNNVTPVLATSGPAALLSGPTPATIPTLPALSTIPVNWVYQINNAAATNPFTFNGSAIHSLPSPPAATAVSPSIKRGEFPSVVNPSVTNASSTNVELTWSVTNSGCAAVRSVAINFPLGWVWANDAYSVVNLSATNPVETWVASGTNPVIFASPDLANQLPLGFSGDFSLVFSSTPSGAGTSGFSLDVTDANNITINVPVSVTVNPFNAGAGGLNSVTNKIWREQIR